jgi:AraC-like DNA-binding protein
MFVSVLLVRGIAAEFRLRGLDGEAWLRDAGVDHGTLSDVRAGLTADSWNRLLRRGMQLLRDPGLGLTLGFGHAEGMLQLLGYMLLSSQTLLEAFEICQRYSTLIVDDLRVELVQSDARTHFRFSFHPASSPESRRFGEDLVAALALRIAKHHVPKLLVSELRLRQPEPSYRKRFEEHFGSKVRFGCEHNELVLPTSAMQQVQPHADPRMLASLAGSADRFLRDRPAPSFANRVRLLLSQMTDQPELEAKDVATKLGMSERMLRRRLQPEGVSLRELIDESRMRAACQGLTLPNTSIKDVAERLGYSEPSAFHRAFKRWTGTTPADYQRMNERPKSPSILPGAD